MLQNAYQFGLTRNSHMSFAFDDAKVREKYAEFKLGFQSHRFITLILIAWTADVESSWFMFVSPRLILEFELRTKEDSGLLLYMARINHADFVSIQVSRPCSLP